MKPATITGLQRFSGDGRDHEGSYTRWVNERRDAIEAARSEGHTLEEIGQALGISRQRVHQLLSDREKGAA